MASYYNRTRGPLNIELSGGGSIYVGPKSRVEVNEANESLNHFVRIGLLTLMPSLEEAPMEVTKAEVPAVVEEVKVASISLDVSTKIEKTEADSKNESTAVTLPAVSNTELSSPEVSAIDTTQRQKKSSTKP
jgi:hypothetical protein